MLLQAVFIYNIHWTGNQGYVVGHANCEVGKGVSTLSVLPICYAIEMPSRHGGLRRVCSGSGVRTSTFTYFWLYLVFGDC